jgi:glucokinase
MAGDVIVGVDLGGTNVRAAAVRDGKIVKRAVRRISGKAAEEVVLGEIFETIDEVVGGGVAGIGIGVPSVVDVERGIVYAVENIPAWREVPLKDRLESRYGCPAYINNDANAFALGELHFGKGRGYRNMVAVTIGTGLGSGIIIDGRLYSGPNCGAGEIGSIPYRDATVERYAAGQFFEHEAGVGGDVVFERARGGDAEALRLFHAFGLELGHAILTILYAYDPELIVLGGSIARALPFFEGGMRERLKSFAYQHALKKLVIACSENEDVATLGAAALYVDAAGKSGSADRGGGGDE